jgi:nucleotide-binding universal stress UspA family protein
MTPMSGRTNGTVPTVVVGYDGSDAARAAVTFAARRVGQDGRLVIVHSYGLAPHFLAALSSVSHEVLDLADRPVTIVPSRNGRDG